MTWPAPSNRVLLTLHAAWAVPLAALAAWFGWIDAMPFGEGRCPSCGVEGYVIAAHVAAAVWLGGVVACVAAARRQLLDQIAAPGPVTTRALAAVAALTLAGLLWHPLLGIPAFAAMIASLALFPVAAVGWVLVAVAWWRSPATDEAEMGRRLSGTLAGAWVSLTVLLPATFGWVWADRVEWFVF